MDTVKVIIKKSSKPTYWYANHIGEVFECFPTTHGEFQVSQNLSGIIQYITQEDCIPYNYVSYKPIKKLSLGLNKTRPHL